MTSCAISEHRPSVSTAPAMEGAARLNFAVKDGETRLAKLYQKAPLRVLFPAPTVENLPEAALITTSGGLVAGDRLDLEIEIGPKARALITAQAAEKVYRSEGQACLINVHLRAGPGAWLEFLPQETILFENARLRRLTLIERAVGAKVMAGEFLVFGRIARGERLTSGLVRDEWQVRLDGRLVWAEALHLDGAIGDCLTNPAAFDGATACATLVLSADDAAHMLPAAREAVADFDGKAGASIVNGQLVVRLLHHDAFALRQAYATLWAELRYHAAGLPKMLPRLWHV